MAYEKKFYPNGGALFAVKDKKSDKAPDLTGNLAIGVDTVAYILEQANAGNAEITLDLSAWKKVSGSGSKFLSVSIKQPFVKGQAPYRPRRQGNEDADTDIPF